MIKVIGLGCQNNQITLQGDKLVKASKHVFVKTALTDTYKYFVDNNIENTPLDFLYEKAEDFNGLDEEVVNYLLSVKAEDICFCVNGNGYEDRSVQELQKHTEVEIIPSVGLGFTYLQPSLFTTKISAYELIGIKGFNYDSKSTLIITETDNELVASDVKLVLSNILGDEQRIYFNGQEICVYEIDRQKNYDYSTTIICPPINLIEKKRFNFSDLYSIMQVLRSENGCEWDKAQTHETIRENVIEEAYELVEAINNKDIDNMIEESGDVLLQSVFQIVIGEDQGEFNTEDVLTGLCRKLIDRHTHIFGNVVANTPEEALKAWDAAKAKEKKYVSFTSKMDGIAKSIPILMRTKKVQNIAKKANFDFGSIEDAANKLKEELQEVEQASDNEREMEGGDLLFSAINVLRLYKIDPEVALCASLDKFIKRFKYVEKHCDDMTTKTPEELDKLWEEAKVETSEC